MRDDNETPSFAGGQRGKYAAAFRRGYGVRVLSEDQVVEEYVVRPAPRFPLVDRDGAGGHRVPG